VGVLRGWVVAGLVVGAALAVLAGHSSLGSHEHGGALEGTWYWHGVGLEVRRGAAHLVYRTYVECEPGEVRACDRVKGHSIISGGDVHFALARPGRDGRVVARVVSSTDPSSYPVRGTAMLRRLPGSYLAISPDPMGVPNLCPSQRIAADCGA
jgi:hypothetical protein